MVICFFLSALFMFLGKAISDIVSDETNWRKSIFSKYKIDSFWGCKDNTDHRKYNDNKILEFLFKTILVWLTDIWHLGGAMVRFGTYSSILFSFLLCFYQIVPMNLFLVYYAIFIMINLFGFHFSYHFFLRKKEHRVLY